MCVPVSGPPARRQHVRKVMAGVCEAVGKDSGAAEEKWQLMSSTEGREQTVMIHALFIILRRALFSAAERPEYHAETQCIRMLSVLQGYQQHLIKVVFVDDVEFVWSPFYLCTHHCSVSSPAQDSRGNPRSAPSVMWCHESKHGGSVCKFSGVVGGEPPWAPGQAALGTEIGHCVLDSELHVGKWPLQGDR